HQAGLRARRRVDEQIIVAAKNADVGDDLALGIERGGVLAVSRRKGDDVVSHQSGDELGRGVAADANAAARAAIDEHRRRAQRGVLAGNVPVVHDHGVAADIADGGERARYNRAGGHVPRTVSWGRSAASGTPVSTMGASRVRRTTSNILLT